MTSIDPTRARRRTSRPLVAALVAVLTVAAVGGVVIALAGAGAGPARAAASASLRYTNPMRDGLTGQPLSCPDPSVIKASQRGFDYFLYCTSDDAVQALPIWKSIDLVHWYPAGYVFPTGHQPAWALPTSGHNHSGLFWGPAVYRIGNRYVMYYSARVDTASGATGSLLVKPNTMALGVATAPTPTGPWVTKLLHFPGELNDDNAAPNLEKVGGDIDPAAVQDPRTGAWYLFWAEQKTQIWEAPLSADGLTLGPRMQIAFGVSKPWECDPGNDQCVVEGPEPFYHDGRIYVLYSAASTWDTSYVVGVAASAHAMDPAQPFVKFGEPILKSAPGFIGPGGESDPVPGPQNQMMILYHAELTATAAHSSAARVLQLGSLNWVDGWPLIGNGVAGYSLPGR